MVILNRVSAVTIAFGFATINSTASAGDNPTLWKLQKTLASKKYVDLTHVFAPGIPRWPGFPDETRKTFTGTTNDPTLRAQAFSLSYLHMLANGAHMSIRLHISSKVCVRWIRLISRR